MTNFSEYIRETRTRKDLSLKEVAEKGGFSHSYLSQIETGKRGAPKSTMIKKLAEGLGVPYLLLLEKAGHLEEGTFQKRLDLMKEANKSLNTSEHIEARENLEVEWKKNNNYIELTEVFSDKTMLAIDGNLLISNGKPITAKEKEKILEMIKTYLS
ncbi:helix-turn-helix domain-containing protein [Planococcus faecalis]|uniref:HTH cro/C1-type domain-containing protein n=1 Tax=Planococcus faecalis TaxID=1598147 RepID=A0ABM6IR70_9BACL|nr:transcriptional regulator [Planococcus faecalis]AQU78304.1 hypothetical protein AJGP001_02875 [Planococcus faecalis]OHX51310.1 hypothetical protein BB777_17365 [Planococcus faecalis]